MKALSIKQPHAAFVCAGIKTVENRTWKTEYRGRIYIHASGECHSWPAAQYLPSSFIDRCRPWIGKSDLSNLPADLRRYHNLIVGAYNFYGRQFDVNDECEWIEDATKEYGFYLRSQAIIGEVDIIDIVRDSDNEFAVKDCFNWILGNAEMYETPIYPVIGKVRLWTYTE